METKLETSAIFFRTAYGFPRQLTVDVLLFYHHIPVLLNYSLAPALHGKLEYDWCPGKPSY